MRAAEMERLVAVGQFETALAAAERIRAEATAGTEEELAGLGHFYAGFIHHLMGNPQQSESHLDGVLGWLTPERRARVRAAIGMDLLANALAFSALNRWFLGYPEQALARSRQAIAAARAEASPVGQAASAALGAKLLFFLRVDERAMAELSEECRRLSLQQGLAIWRVHPEVLLGRLMVARGDEVAGIERIRGAGWQGSDIVLDTGFFVVALADSCLLAAGRRDGAARADLLATGLAAIEGVLPLPPLSCGTGARSTPLRSETVSAALRDNAHPTARRDSVRSLRSTTGQVPTPGTVAGPAGIRCGRCYEAEMRRLRGELLRARDGPAAAGEALACFKQALQLGREQGALAWQLRAAMSLVRLRERDLDPQSAKAQAAANSLQEELAEARSCLRDIYGRFTEGFAFPDLQDAATLAGD